jgi:hypothetical protein
MVTDMKKWKIFVTFFKNLYDDHYTLDSSFDMQKFTFVKVNDKYAIELDENRLNYDIFFEHDFKCFNPAWQEKGYHENSVFYHIYKDNLHRDYDYIGFIEYDHVLRDHFTRDIQNMIDSADRDLAFIFNKFNFHQYWEQGILMDPRRPQKETGNPHSEWNCINIVLKDFNKFHGTNFRLEDLIRKDCFSVAHCFMLPSSLFDTMMVFHSAIMDSGKVEQYHQHNWRARAGLMERYLAVALALQDIEAITDIQLEHRSSYPIKVLNPDWFKPTFYQRMMAYIYKHL